MTRASGEPETGGPHRDPSNLNRDEPCQGSGQLEPDLAAPGAARHGDIVNDPGSEARGQTRRSRNRQSLPGDREPWSGVSGSLKLPIAQGHEPGPVNRDRGVRAGALGSVGLLARCSLENESSFLLPGCWRTKLVCQLRPFRDLDTEAPASAT